MSAGRPAAVHIGRGVYRVSLDGRNETVYVAGAAGDRWAFWNGRCFRSGAASRTLETAQPARSAAAQSLTAPMPATVLQVLVVEGSVVRKGDTVLILEAMKMELPVRTAIEGVVAAVHCREGELVQPDMVLVEIVPATNRVSSP